MVIFTIYMNIKVTPQQLDYLLRVRSDEKYKNLNEDHQGGDATNRTDCSHLSGSFCGLNQQLAAF